MNQQTGPNFKNPPVVETVLSIQFNELEDFRTTHFGLFHSRIRDRYPVAQDKQRLEPIIETFPLLPRMRTLQFKPHEGAPERVWYRDGDSGCEMLQLQPDRFAFNWCHQEGQPIYPRYKSNRPKLLEEFDRFQDFAAEQNLGIINPNLCEVIYVNHIRPRENESVMECFSSVFDGIDWVSSDGWLPQPPEIVTLNRVFTIGDEKGRLYIEASIANEKTGGKFILLKITARVIHNDGDELGENLNLAHDWVVNSFVSVTDDRARQERWEQQA